MAGACIGTAIVLALTFLAACGSQTDQPVVTSQQLAGTWASAVGGTLVLRADHHFTAAGLRLTYYRGGSATCPPATFSGTWQFLTAQWEPDGRFASGGLNPRQSYPREMDLQPCLPNLLVIDLGHGTGSRQRDDSERA